MSKRLRIFLKNAVVMVLSALLLRTVSVTFQAYLADRLGAEGMGVFSLVGILYGFGVTFSLSGVTLAVTRLVAESVGRGEMRAARAALRRATRYALLFSLAATAVLFFGADGLAAVALGDSRAALSVRLLSLSFVPLALSGVMGGYFTAVGRVSGVSATQVTEMGVRILLTVFLFVRFPPSDLTSACAVVSLGMTVSQIVSTLILFVLYCCDRRRYLRGDGGSTAGVTRRLLHIALPVAASTYVRSGLLTVEHLLIPRALARGGAGKQEAVGTYGTLTGMALPVVLYPMGLLTACSPLLVPAFSEYTARGETVRAGGAASRALHLTCVGSVGCAAVLLIFSGEIGRTLYATAAVGKFIAQLAPVLPVMFLDHVTDCVLKGVGEQVYIMAVNMADSALSILLVWLILPVWGAAGYAAVIILAELFNFALSFSRLCRVLPIRFSLLRSCLLPAVAALLSAYAVHRFLWVDPYVTSLAWMIARMAFVGACYLAVLAGFTVLGRAGKRKIACLDILS